MTGLAGLHHAALSVRDLDASARWYSEVLGLEETFRRDEDSRRMLVMRFPGRSETLGLVEHEGAGQGFNAANLGLDHLAFNVGSMEELETWAHRFDEWQVTNSGCIGTPFGAMLNFEDPDGIALALFWERS